MPGALNVSEQTQLRLNTNQAEPGEAAKDAAAFPEAGEGKCGCIF